ncbi:hypothetical protein DFS34DRAFT_612998 [Phlyctochytrium arcticum]|nr:hypothetical protein DFS34DRAFT_612998 [Phlyctochytrium arcticum]
MAASGASGVWRSRISSNVPSPRVGHTLSYVPGTRECVLFGGASHEAGFSNDVHILNLGSSEWRPGVPKNQNLQKAPPRYEHSAAIIERNNGSMDLLVMFGAGDEGLTDDVWTLDLQTYQWTSVTTKGKKPSPRTLHSIGHISTEIAGRRRDRLYVFGGGTSADEAVSDSNTYCLDTSTMLWIQVASGTHSPCPQPRLGHTLTAIGDKVYMYGGMNGDITFDDLWIFDTLKNAWTLEDTSGDNLPPRSGHTATAVGDRIVFYGGFSKQPVPKVFDDVIVFDTRTNNVLMPSIAAEPPGAPCGLIDHDACSIHHLAIAPADSKAEDNTNSVLLFGGMDLGGMYNYLFELTFSS